jgi:F420-dependent oxidoreductase-like protein
VKIGLQIPDFSTPDGPPRLGADLATVARTADEGGFEFIAVMDHFFQIRGVGPAEREMLEAYTTLGYLAACTSRVKLLTLVTGAVYRYPGVLAKIVTTLDVLSAGRAWLGIGAAWNEDESRSLGFPFPPLGERFERLEETLRIAHAMFEGERGSEGRFEGRHYRAERLLNSPQSLSRPRVPIMVGGGGERKTLRLVAQYADACNVFGTPEAIARKYAILADHCAVVGRDPAQIERSTLQNVRVGPGRAPGTESPAQVVDRFGELADAGAEHVVIGIRDLADPAPLELIGREVIPHLRSL